MLATLVVDTVVDENDGIGVGGVSLRDAIAAAAPGDVVEFAPPLTADGPATILLTHGHLVVNKNLSIVGPGANLLTIDASGNDPDPGSIGGNGSRVFFISDNLSALRTVSLAGMTLTGGDATGPGGAILAAEHLTISDSIITGNATTSAAVQGGGGIYSSSGDQTPATLTVLNSAVTNNVANSEGGGIRKRYGTLTIENSTIAGNQAGTAGGGLSAADGNVSVMIHGSFITDNFATGVDAFDGGAGVFVFRGSASIVGSTVSGNQALDHGGGIYGYQSTVSILQSTISGNSARYGGGIYNRGTLTVTESTVSGNKAYSVGGAVFNRGRVTIVASQIAGNFASSQGGGVLGTDGPIQITDSQISGNDAGYVGGGIYAGVNAPLTLAGSSITGNTSNSSGAGVYSRSATTLTQSLVGDNVIRFYGFGGGLCVTGQNLTIADSTIDSNSSPSSGGGVVFRGYNRTLSILRSSISSNESKYGNGGGVYAPYGGQISVASSTISGNRAISGTGGAIASGANSTTLVDSQIDFNQADTGGGVSNFSGYLQLVDSVVSNNSARLQAGGLFNSGNAVVQRTAITGNSAGGAGGGIVSRYGSLTIDASSIRSNAASAGGGVYASGSNALLLANSTISGNSSSFSGGGMFLRGAAFALTNSTVSNNFAGASGGGVYAFDAYDRGSSIESCTITANGAQSFGGGLAFVGQAPALLHAIVAGNYAPLAPDLAAAFATLVVHFSLIGDGFGSTLAEAPLGSPDGNGNLIGGPANGVIFAGLEFLADNGGQQLRDGSFVQSHSLSTGSAAIDAGDPAAVAGVGGIPDFDERGAPFQRVVDGNADGVAGIDLGAVEQQALSLVVDTLVDEDDGDLSPGDLSLREALRLTTGNAAAGDSIHFAAPLAGGVVQLNLGPLQIDGEVTIVGLGAELLTIDASGNDPTPFDDLGDGSSVFDVSFAGVVEISGLTLTGGDANIGGAIFSIFTDLTVAHSVITGNSARFSGGGVEARYSGSLTLADSEIRDNHARYGDGGAILTRYLNNVTLSNSVITGNHARRGGAVAIFGSVVSLTGSTLNGNFADYEGGAIFSSGATSLTLTDSALYYNRARRGGAIFSYQGVELQSCTVYGNIASETGGGVYAGGDVTISASNVLYNRAENGGGGGIYCLGELTIAYAAVGFNHAGGAAGFGGGAYCHSIVTIDSSTISDNSAAASGGGVYVAATGVAALRHSTVSGNAGTVGGGLFITAGTLSLDHTIVADNLASFGPDLTGLIGLAIDAQHSLIGDNANTGLAASITGAPDAKGNLIGPTLSLNPLVVNISMAAMGDFEAGANGDSFNFEYSIDGGPFQPLFTSLVDESLSAEYFMANGRRIVLEDPLLVNGAMLTNYFQTLTAVIPVGGSSIRVRFTATNDGPSEAFAWRDMIIYPQSGGATVGAALQYYDFYDQFTSYVADTDYTIAGDMFGIRARYYLEGVPSIPFDLVDDSVSIFPNDVQGIVTEFDSGRFFGVVDTVNGSGGNTNSATWTFTSPLAPINPGLGPLQQNGGRTWTRELLPGSPAIDAGDAAAPGVPQFDQRGAPFVRVFNGDGDGSVKIDIGAFERQSPTGSSDFDGNGAVEGGDFLAWQRAFGSLPPTGQPDQGDADGDFDVDSFDFDLWQHSFGSSALASGAVESSVSSAAADARPLSAPAVDAALAYLQSYNVPTSRPLFRPRVLRAR